MGNILKISEDHQNTELNVQILHVLQNWLSREQSTGPCRKKTSSHRVFSSAQALREVMFLFEVYKAFMSQISFIKSTGCTKHCEGFHLEKQFWHMSLILLHSHRRHVSVSLVCCSCFRIDKHAYFLPAVLVYNTTSL